MVVNHLLTVASSGFRTHSLSLSVTQGLMNGRFVSTAMFVGTQNTYEEPGFPATQLLGAGESSVFNHCHRFIPEMGVETSQSTFPLSNSKNICFSK